MKVYRVEREFFRKLISQLKKAGVSPEQLLSELRRQGVTAPDIDQALILSSEKKVLLQTAVKLTGDLCLMIGLGHQIGIASYGSLGFALMNCVNLRKAIHLFIRYGKIVFPPRWTVHKHEGGLLLRLNITHGTVARQQIVSELIFSTLFALGGSLSIKGVDGVELQLSYSRPSHSACYKSVFRVPVTFDGEHSQLFLPEQALDKPVKTADCSAYVVFHQQCEEMLRGLSSAEKTTTAVRQLLIQSAGDFLSCAQVAESLHVSERTLRRRLKAESTHFRVIIGEISGLLAQEYLTETDLTVADIAHLLNYADTAAFRRAFVRWNGVTPNEYRQQHMVETDYSGSIVPV